MDVYEELEEAKAEIEKLKVEQRDKTNSLQNLKKSYYAQANKIQEAIFKVEKLNQELLQKEHDTNDDLDDSLNNKEFITKHLSAANNELGVNCDDKFRKWQDEKRDVLALKEANEKVENQEQQMQEIESMKGCISVPKNKCLEIEEKLEASSELGETNDMFQKKLEEENMKVEEQLKWKKGHFKHLEEVHEKLIDQFKASKKEWELEKSTLLDEISSFQSLLDCHKRKPHDLQHQLEMCNQALAHEESLRKCLEDEVSNLNREKEEKYFQLPHNELDDSHKEMLKESTRCRFLKEKINIEIGFKEQLKEVYDALERANIELDERMCERSEMEFELRIWKSFGERLKNGLEENLAMRKELENPLLAQVDFSESLKQEKDSLVSKLEEKENKIDCLQKHVLLFEQEPKVKETEAASVPETVEVTYLHIMEEKNKILEELQKEVLRLEQESFRREFERERTNELEEENPIQIIKGKNIRTDEIMQQVTSLEQKFTRSLTSISSQL